MRELTMSRLRLLLVAIALAAGATFSGRLLADTAAPLSDAAFFDDSVVQRIDFQMNQRDWDSLTVNYLDNTYYPADFKWKDQTIRSVGIRSRGTGSRSGTKPGLRVDFNRYATSQIFLGRLKAFILRNQ